MFGPERIPLEQFTYTIKNTFNLMGKNMKYSVPLTGTIDIILDRVYDRKEISTVVTRNEMKKFLTLCTKDVHFILNNETYVQNDGVAMGSPLGPILAKVFMVELEITLVPRLHQHIKKWRSYVDDTFGYIKNESIDYALTKLKSFHPNISFTYEKENNSQLHQALYEALYIK